MLPFFRSAPMGWIGISQITVTPSCASASSRAVTPSKSPPGEKVRVLIS
jgi:hypothetical protein